MNKEGIAYKLGFLLMFTSIFLAGWLSSSIFEGTIIQNPLNSDLFGARERISPSDHIKQEDIHVYKDRVVIDVPNVQWAKFTDTNSMDPFLDIEANSFEIIPQSEEQIQVGDIISYQPESFSGLIVHRVIEINEDKDGWYAIVKGDNLSSPDPGRVRFDQVSGILVGVIY